MDINRAVEDLQSAAGLVSESLEGLGYGVGDALGAGHGLEPGEAAAKRVKGFAAHFAKQLESAEASVRSSSDALRGDALNSVTTADANATSEIPALARATSAAAKNAAEKLKELPRERRGGAQFAPGDAGALRGATPAHGAGLPGRGRAQGGAARARATRHPRARRRAPRGRGAFFGTIRREAHECYC